ncbi:MAG TPA: tRNA-binding protein [Acidimicrobiia bacterium]|nr:tRNA-binding protein [Acidimicrobiia bacterium]
MGDCADNGTAAPGVPGNVVVVPTIDDWHALQVRTGTVLRAEDNTGARHPAYRMWIDFGELGTLQSSAKITDHYRTEDLIGSTIVAVTGFAPRHVNGFRSDVLVLGVLTDGGVVLLRPDRPVPPGSTVA